MATKKLTESREVRAALIPAANILPALPDGRMVIIGKSGIHVANRDYCSCGDSRYAKQTCRHSLRIRML